MFGIPQLKFITILLSLLLLSACAQVDPTLESDPAAAVTSLSPTPVVVRILNLDLVAAAKKQQVLPTSTPLPTLAPPPTRVASVGEASTATVTVPVCSNSAEFIKNLSIADNTVLKPGQAFAKIWQIKNIGTCSWTTAYSLVYASGDSMGSQAMIPLPHEVNPGESIDLRLSLIAPADPKTYTGNWYLQDASGAIFGLGTDAAQPLMVTIIVKPLPKPPT